MNFKTEQLTVGYDGKPLIKDIDITLERGQILTLVGPNGSGKSTILKSIALQLKPLGGAVYINNADMGGMSGEATAKALAAVFTERLNPELATCRDVVSVGRYPYTGAFGVLAEADKAKIREAMELTGVWELRGRALAQISDGQRSRVLLARALCQEPGLILLDEPTSFLDVKHIYALLKILKTLAAERGVTIIMSLHQIEMARKISDITMCVKGEYVFKYGAPGETLTKQAVIELYDLDDESYAAMFGSGGSSAFFANKECKYFPCHSGVAEGDFNCLFCYCPLYALDGACGGGFSTTAEGVKDCSACAFPHRRENYARVIGKLKKPRDLSVK